MGFLRIIWKDVLSLSSRFTPAVKVAGLVFLIALIVAAWHLGTRWWNRPVTIIHESRPCWAVVLLLFVIGFSVYLGWVIDRYRRGR
jgi:uncharacterized membrane protein YoaK (UPF0700 family)